MSAPRGEAQDAGGRPYYRAFISHSRSDLEWAKWIHRALETYRPPRGVGDRAGYLKPVFRDDDELAASSDLSEELRSALAASEALIVICSPAAAKSDWVDEEIRRFKSASGGAVLAMVVDGSVDRSGETCFPPALFERRSGESEPLAIDVRLHGKRDTLLKLAAGLLRVRYDALKRRDRQRRIRRGALGTFSVLAVLTAYAATLVVQTRTVNTQFSSLLSALSVQSTDAGDHGQALRFAMLAAHERFLSPPAPEADAALARAAHNSIFEAELSGHQAAVYGAAFDASGTRLVTGSQDATVRVWRLDQGGGWLPDGPAIETGGHVFDVRFAERDSALVVVHSGAVSIWRPNGNAWSQRSVLGDFAGHVRAFDIDAAGTLAVVGVLNPTGSRNQNGGALDIWRFDGTWTRAAHLSVPATIPVSIAISPTRTRLAVGYVDGSLRIWTRDTDDAWTVEHTLSPFQAQTIRLSFDQAGDRLVAVGQAEDVAILDFVPPDGRTEVTRLTGDTNVTFASLARDGSVLVTNGTEHEGVVRREEAGSRWIDVGQFGVDGAYARVALLSPDDGRIVTAGNDHSVRIWRPGLGTWASYARAALGSGDIDIESWVDEHMGAPEVRALSIDSTRLLRGNVYGIVTIIDQPSGIVLGHVDASSTPRYRIELSAREDTIRIFRGDEHEPDRVIDARLLVALRGSALRAAVCREKLRGDISRLTNADILQAPILRPRLGESVCKT